MPEMRVGALRLRRVRFKDGRAPIEVMRGRDAEMEGAFVRNQVERLLAGIGDRIAGFAVVIWALDNGLSAAIQVNDGSKIPAILVPDFVRNRLLAEKIEGWTLDGLRDKGVI